MLNGTVKFFDEIRGFGFIIDNDSKEEFFVHASGLIDTINDGEQVTFRTTHGKKGLNAVDVKRA